MAQHTNAQAASWLCPDAGRLLMGRVSLLAVLSLAANYGTAAQTNALQGTVRVSAAKGQNERLPGASLSLTSASPGQSTLSAITNEQGEYKFI